MDDQKLQQIIQQGIKEAHALGIQSGKQETSGLVEMILHKMEEPIEKAVDKHVNGKIKALGIKIDDYIVSDLKWKEEITPQIQLVKDTQGFGKVSLYFIGFVSAIVGVILLIYNLLKLK